MLKLLTWLLLHLIAIIVLVVLAYKDAYKSHKRAAIYALIAYLLFAVVGSVHILMMRGSTAGIGFLFLPLYALVPAAAGYLFGKFHALFREQRQTQQPATKNVAGMTASAVLLLTIFGWQLVEIQQTAATNEARDLQQAQRKAVIDSNRGTLQQTLAMHPGGEAEKLVEIADGTDDDTLLIPVAESQYAPEDLLDRLAKLNNPGLGITVIRNPNTSPETLEWLFHYSRYPAYYYSDLSRNRKTPEPILRELYELRHVNGGIAWSLAGNESTPIDILQKLVDEPDENVQRHLLNNPSYTQNQF